MNTPSTPPPVPQTRSSPIAHSGTLIKMIIISVLVVVLFIPLILIRSVLSERLSRRDEAIRNITSTWGTEQVVVGPILTIPYRYQAKVWKDMVVNGRNEKVEVVEAAVATASFLPADLVITGKLAPSVLHRGIYDTVVYSGALDISGRFNQPSFDEWKVKPDDILWDDAVVTFAITDLRGVKEALTLKWGERTVNLTPGTKLAEFPSGVHARLKGETFGQDAAKFQLSVTLNGSKGISFMPIGTQNTVKLESTWPDPSFRGAFLPVDRRVDSTGFEATWKMSYYGRSFPQQWSSLENRRLPDLASPEASFGVDLIAVVDSYRNVERAIKYGILFVVLIFTAFFLFEVLSPLRIHPFQYTLVGVALCLFYLALLSLSEVTSFGLSYLAGAVAASVMITLYSARVLRSLRRSLVIAGELAVIYGFLYVILRLQDYSLLFGTVGLFIALGIVMYATRNIDWYARDEGKNQ